MKERRSSATLGPASGDRDRLVEMARAGMDVARLNFSHGTHEWHAERLRLIRELEPDLGRPISVLQDLYGPKLRIGDLPAAGLELRRGGQYLLSTEPFDPGPPPRIPVPVAQLVGALRPGHRVYLDDGQLEMAVLDRRGPDVLCQVEQGGLLLSHKGITAPSVPFDMPALTPKDLADLAFGLRLGVDWVAVSFVRRAADLEPVRAAVERAGRTRRSSPR